MAHQWVAEVLIARKAASKNVTLPHRYWVSDPYWAKEFTRQVQQAGRLIKLHGEEAVMNIVKRESWSYSLMNPEILAAIKAEGIKIKNRPEPAEEKPVENPNVFSPVKKSKKSLLGKLNERNQEET